jgi:DNA-binding XRE family transcriptional regulator
MTYNFLINMEYAYMTADKPTPKPRIRTPWTDPARLKGPTLEQLKAYSTAESLFLARTQLGLTQSQMAELIGTTQDYISRLENGNARISKRMARLYHLTVTQHTGKKEK